MKKSNRQLENSLIKRSSSTNTYVLTYLKGWEESLMNFNEFVKEEFTPSRKDRVNYCLSK